MVLRDPLDQQGRKAILALQVLLVLTLFGTLLVHIIQVLPMQLEMLRPTKGKLGTGLMQMVET
jgi:hypothetical protein